MVALMDCPHCHAVNQDSQFCRACSRYMADPTGTVEKVTYNRRLFGDSLLESALFVVTLGIGWLIWLAFTAQTAQTPAKRMVGTYILDLNTGQPISAGRVWVREVLVKIVLITLVGAFIGVASLINAIWVFFDKNRQALHDKVVGTIVVYAPLGLPMLAAAGQTSAQPWSTSQAHAGGVRDAADELRELARLHDEGILTDEEYERKRSQIAGRL